MGSVKQLKLKSRKIKFCHTKNAFYFRCIIFCSPIVLYLKSLENLLYFGNSLLWHNIYLSNIIKLVSNYSLPTEWRISAYYMNSQLFPEELSIVCFFYGFFTFYLKVQSKDHISYFGNIMFQNSHKMSSIPQGTTLTRCVEVRFFFSFSLVYYLLTYLMALNLSRKKNH